MFPRYFVPGAAGSTPLPTLHLPLVREILDVFRCPLFRGRRSGGPHGEGAVGEVSVGEVAVVVDATGQLHLLDDPSALPPPLLASLHRHELTRGPARTLDVAELWLFELQGLEQPPPGVPGINDPVHLLGRLHGPWGTPAEPSVTAGTLTVTRCDAIAGIVEELPHAFPAEDGSGCHLLLPAAPPGEVAGGHGVVLGWPLAPAELSAGPAGNDVLTGELLYDLLAAFQEDVREGGLPHPLASVLLPVPDRAGLVAEWERDGWTIDGKIAQKGSFFRRQSRAVPEEGSLVRWAALASQSLAAVPGWPSERSRALRQRVRSTPPEGPTRVRPSGPPVPPRIPRPSGEPPGAGGEVTTRHPAKAGSPSNAGAPRAPSGKARPADAPPDWMGDFAAPPSTGRPSRIGSVRGRQKTPHWMRDFDP